MSAVSGYLWGPLTRTGVAIAAAVAAADQAVKLWLLFVYDLGSKDIVPVAPLVNLVLVWNRGISYGWFQQQGLAGQMVLLGIKALAVAFLWAWLARADTRLSAASLGMIIGGAAGNAIDRVAHGAVVDYVMLSLETASLRFDWYVFNLADVAIVAGVAGLLYESFFGDNAAKAPRSPS